MLALTTTDLGIQQLEPFLIDIADLEREGIPSEWLQNRPLFQPTNVGFRQQEMIQCVRGQIASVSEAIRTQNLDRHV